MLISKRAAAAALEREFGRVRSAWYGSATGRWWALVDTHRGPRLVEAINPRQLRDVVVQTEGQPWPSAERWLES